MRVLSVDWDYFIDATADQRYLMFPDGGNENLPPEIGDTIWAARYSEHKELSKIGIDKSGFNKLKRIINKFCTPYTKIFIADSHVRMYDFIKDNWDYDDIVVDNIDFHHDYYEWQETEIDVSQTGIKKKAVSTERVNCGNWARILMETDFPNELTYNWVCREDSDLSERLEKHPNFGGYMMIEDLLNNEQTYDLLYICRSSMWSPPHLDQYFFDFLEKQVKAIGTESIEFGFLTENRYTDQMKAQIKEYNDFLEGTMKDLHRKERN